MTEAWNKEKTREPRENGHGLPTPWHTDRMNSDETSARVLVGPPFGPSREGRGRARNDRQNFR